MAASSNVNPWVTRLERRLIQLADTASKESIQALAKWIGFRRKYAKEFSSSLANAIANPTALEASHNKNRQWLYLQILHESILLDSGTSRWDRLAEMREILGEFCMMEVAQQNCLDATTITKVEGMIKQWDAVNCFGGPTLITMIRKQLTAPPPPTTATMTTTTTPPKSPKRTRSPSPVPPTKKEPTPPKTVPETDADAATIQEEPKPDDTPKPSSKTAEITTPTPTKSPKKEVVYDFESKNIPQGKVDAKEFLAPCKAIATLQIARDLRNDNAVQVSSLLQGLPEEIQQLCEEADQQVQESGGKPYELPERKARELSIKISERLLDLDIDEQLQNVRTFFDLIEKQQEARKALIYLLVRSRCQFGSREAAEEFFKLETIQAELQKRKDTLMDAMALEGLDFDEEERDKDKTKKKEREFAPLTWYLEEKNGEPDAKRAKVESVEVKEE